MSVNPRVSLNQIATFTYDKAGNNKNHNALYNLLNNQMKSSDIYTVTYDNMGNIKTKYNKLDKTTSNYTFNARNQLLSYTKQDENNQTTKTLTYTYDAFNRRASKIEGNITQKYLYDGDDIVAILDNSNAVIATITHDESIDIPLSITNSNGTFYYHRDHQGSIVALTNSSGAVVESFTYDNHYGTITNHTRTTETNNPYAYTGRGLDTEELYYYRARYYDPAIERFLGEDPIGFDSGDFNFYRYVSNSPINFIDPSGMDCISTCLLNYPGSWIYLGALSPLVNLKTPSEYASARRRIPKASPWTSVDRRLGLKPRGGATTRGKPIGKGGSIAIGMGAFAAGYFLGALANCSLKCNNFCSTL